MMPRNKLLTCFFSLCPGAGQMYQGYMKRGLSLALLFALPILAGYAFYMPLLLSLSAIAYMYSFFDSLNLHAQLSQAARDGLPAPADESLIHIRWAAADWSKLAAQQHRLLGWGLVLLGSVTFYRSMLSPLLRQLVSLLPESPASAYLWNLLYDLPDLAFSLVLVLVGRWLIRGPKKQPPQEFEDYKGADDHA